MTLEEEEKEEGQETAEDIEGRYREMMSSLELVNIRVIDASLSIDPDIVPGKPKINIEKTTDFGIRDEDKRDFRFTEHLCLNSAVEEAETEFFTLCVSILLQYRSPIETDERLLEMFANRNLSVHSWPYLREFIQNMSARMGLPPMVLPLLLPKPQAD